MNHRGRRHKLKSPYHYDDRFGLRKDLNSLVWDEGKLVDSKDKDSMTGRERDVMIARKLQAIGNSKEMQPDTKLVQVSSGQLGIDVII